MTCRATSLFFVLLLAFASLCYAADTTRTVDPVDALKSHLVYLASDSLEGRLVGTPGIQKAAAYIVERFREIGLKPAFSGSYYQTFEIEFGLQSDHEPSLQLEPGRPIPPDSIAVVPISGSGSVGGRLTSGLPPEDQDLSGKVVCQGIDPKADQQRWTMMGRDGLLEWMREISVQAQDGGAAGVLFVNGSSQEPDAGLHTFPVQRACRRLDIPVLEITYAQSRNAEAGQTSPAPYCSLCVSVRPRIIKVTNVAGVIEGTTRPEECIVLGAHYDHLGYGEIASSRPWRREIHNGADDNASGVAALIETARNVISHGPPECSMIFISFTAEELGALGSEYYCKSPARSMANTVAMINLDVVGRLEDNTLIVFGARSASEFSGLLADANQAHGLKLVEKEEIFGFSDQNPFYARGIPSVHLFTGAHDDYHSPDDDWQNINFDGLAAITRFTADFALELARTARLSPVVALEDQSQTKASRGQGAFLGIIPDFTYSGSGVGIKGAVPQSPAQGAGLEDGDVIIGIDGKPIANLQRLMTFLADRNPGDDIEIQVLRGSSVITRKATLSVRSPGN